MKNNSKGRYFVNIFSDYGLDERQKAISANVCSKCMRIEMYISAFLTLVWLFVSLEDVEVPFEYTALSFWAGTVITMICYGLTASKYGVLNAIFSFSSQTGGIVIGIMNLALGMILIIRGVPTFGIFALITAIYNFIMAWCGKRNDLAIAAQTEE